MRINNHIWPLGSVGTRRSNSYQLLAGLSQHYVSGDPAVMESALWNQQPALGPATDSLSADRVLRMSLDVRSPKRRPQSPLTRPRVWRPMAAPPRAPSTWTNFVRDMRGSSPRTLSLCRPCPAISTTYTFTASCARPRGQKEESGRNLNEAVQAFALCSGRVERSGGRMSEA